MSEKNKTNNYRSMSENRDLRIDIQTILRDLLLSWWIILAAAIIAATVYGSYLNTAYNPRYYISTTFFVGKTGVNSSYAYRNYTSASSLTENFTTIIKSDILQKRICQDLQLNSLDADIEVSTVANTNLMSLSVNASSPKMAYEIIHSAINCGLELCREIEPDSMILTLSEPVIPTGPVNRNNVHSAMLKMGIYAAFLAGILVVLLSFFRDTVKNEGEFRSKIGEHLIATIFHEKKVKTLSRAAKKEFYSLAITNPALSFRYVEANRMMATEVYLQLQKHHAKSVLVTSVSENEGKSTVAANLAIAMANEGHKVCIIDCDFRKPAQYKILEVKEEDLKKNDLIQMISGGGKNRIRHINTVPNLYALLTVQPQRQMLPASSINNLRRIIEKLKDKVDVIVIDTAPWGLVAEGLNIAALADCSMLVVEQDAVITSLINDTIDQIQDTPAHFLGCVYNNVFTTVTGNGHYGYGYGYGHYYGNYNYEKRYRQAAEESSTSR